MTSPEGPDQEAALSEAEREALAELRTKFTTGITTTKAIRFLRARDLKVDKALKMLESDREFRDKVQPEKVTQADIKSALGSGCWRVLGRSKGSPGDGSLGEGGLVIWVQCALWNPHEYSIEEYVRMVGYIFDRAEQASALLGTQPTTIIVFDMAGWALWMAKYYSYIFQLVSIAQNNYPELLKRIYVVNAPVIFKASWAVIKPAVDARTAQKIEWLKGVKGVKGSDEPSEGTKELLSFMEPSMLPSIYGGEADGDKIPVPNIEGEDNVSGK